MVKPSCSAIRSIWTFSVSTSPKISLRPRLRAVGDNLFHEGPAEAMPLEIAADEDRIFRPHVIRIGRDPDHARDRRAVGFVLKRDQRHLAVVVDLSEPCRHLAR